MRSTLDNSCAGSASLQHTNTLEVPGTKNDFERCQRTRTLPPEENTMATPFEDAIAHLKASSFDSPEVIRTLELLGEQNERIKNLEAASLAHKHAIATLDATQHAHGVSIGSLAQDRDTHAARIAEIASKPAANDTKVVELEKRVTAVEGAVGSKAWKRVEPPKPVEVKGDPVKPEAESKSILPGFMQSKPVAEQPTT